MGDRIPGTERTVDDVVSAGIFRLVRANIRRRLSCPFIWLYVLAEHSKDKLLRRLLQIGVEATPYFFSPRPLPGERMFWQDWELFNAQFRVLKDRALVGSAVDYERHHSGMLAHSDAAWPSVLITCSLEAVEQASEQLNTRALPAVVHCESANFSFPGAGDLLFLNGVSSPSGDAFCALPLASGGVLHEVHQYKLYAGGVLTREVMAAERAKAANDADFFMMFTTFGDVDQGDIPPKTGVVVQRNYEEYYGPFAGRAFWLANVPRPKINEASRSFLLMVKGISDVRANRILDERQRQPFSSLEECHTRTNIPKALLKAFDW